MGCHGMGTASAGRQHTPRQRPCAVGHSGAYEQPAHISANHSSMPTVAWDSMTPEEQCAADQSPLDRATSPL
jgi:hypothetical protein